MKKEAIIMMMILEHETRDEMSREQSQREKREEKRKSIKIRF